MYVDLYITTAKINNQIHYGAILKWRHHQKLLTKGFNELSENEVLLRGINEVLSSVHDKTKIVRVDTDVEYIYNSIKFKNYVKWYNEGWKKSDGKGDIAFKEDWVGIYEHSKELKGLIANNHFEQKIELLKELTYEKGDV